MRFIITFLVFTVSIFAQNNLQSGPMVGYCEMKEAMIWLQTEKPAAVYIEYYAIDNTKEVFQSSIYNTTKENATTCHIVLDKLQPGKNIFTLFLLIKRKYNCLMKLLFLQRNYGNGVKKHRTLQLL